MTTLLQKIYRNIGTRQLFTWQDGYFNYEGNTRVAVTVEGTNKATFNAGATNDGYAALSMTLGTSPGVTDGYTFHVIGTSLGAIVNEINAAWASHNAYFAAHPPAAASEGDHIGIVNPYYIKINAYTSRFHFEAIGLPENVIRDIALPAHSDGYVDHKIALFRTDVISDPIAVPDGANVLTLWATLFSHTTDQNMTRSPGLVPLWSNGVEGEPTDNYITKLPWNARLVDGYWNPNPGSMPVDDTVLITSIRLLRNLGMINGNELPFVQPPVEIHIPAGTTHVRIAIAPIPFLSIAEVPTMPQSYRVAVTFAAR